jgi:hypothetical protein
MPGSDSLTQMLFARAQALGHIRLARGVVGKTSIVAGIVFLVLSGVAWRMPTDVLFTFGVILLLGFFAYIAAMLWFAHRHPEQALLEGAEIIQYRQQEMAAKGVTELPRSPSTVPPPVAPEILEER